MRKKIARAITYYTPETNIDFAERRMTDFVDEYNWRQRFSARLPRGANVHPTPTLLDLTVSAYLQGIEENGVAIDDCVILDDDLDMEPLTHRHVAILQGFYNGGLQDKHVHAALHLLA